jgi:hypothetical protein
MGAPRDFLEDASAFGSEPVRWRPDDSHDAPAVAAAYLQHEVAVAVAEARTARHPRLTDKALAAAVGEKSDGALRRKLDGSREASVTDMVAWAFVLGEPVLDRIRFGPNHLLPPEYGPWLGDWRPGGGVIPRFRRPATRMTEVGWNRVIEFLLARLDRLAAQGGLELLVHDALRQMVIEALLDVGIDASRCYLDEELIDFGPVDLAVGSYREDVLEVVFAPTTLASAQEVAAAATGFATTLMRLARAPAQDRTVVAVLSRRVASELTAAIPVLNVASLQPGQALNLRWDGLAQMAADDDLLGDTSVEVRAVQPPSSELPLQILILHVSKSTPIA